MVNPDGVNLVTGEYRPDSSQYLRAQNIARSYPSIPFPEGCVENLARQVQEPKDRQKIRVEIVDARIGPHFHNYPRCNAEFRRIFYLRDCMEQR